mmetsp:Transcript_16967/g.46894  ORF Transcript_16967/g.46894 Transcript_16967/m.46894 type:complete len:206 (-) Transcript_16967:5217-5834(-)
MRCCSCGSASFGGPWEPSEALRLALLTVLAFPSAVVLGRGGPLMRGPLPLLGCGAGGGGLGSRGLPSPREFTSTSKMGWRSSTLFLPSSSAAKFATQPRRQQLRVARVTWWVWSAVDGSFWGWMAAGVSAWCCRAGIASKAFSTQGSTEGWESKALQAWGQLSTFCNAPAAAAAATAASCRSAWNLAAASSSLCTSSCCRFLRRL